MARSPLRTTGRAMGTLPANRRDRWNGGRTSRSTECDWLVFAAASPRVCATVVEELCFVGRAGDAAFDARAVVGDHHDQGVVELTDGAQELDEAAEVVGVAEESCEHLHLARVEPA